MNCLEFPMLIKNGQIVDGTGKPPYRADLRIRDGVIVEMPVEVTRG